ncbi:MAG: hypothetical protein ACM3Q4_10205 [Acidobacteriota bacterium]
MTLIASIADSTITVIGKGIAKRVLHPMGDVTAFTYSSVKHEVTIEITLLGEEESTTILLGDYSVREEGGITQLKFERIDTSKPWLNAAADRFFRGRYMDVPAAFAAEVKAIFGSH